jgi:hypothetical protein
MSSSSAWAVLSATTCMSTSAAEFALGGDFNRILSNKTSSVQRNDQLAENGTKFLTFRPSSPCPCVSSCFHQPRCDLSASLKISQRKALTEEMAARNVAFDGKIARWAKLPAARETKPEASEAS